MGKELNQIVVRVGPNHSMGFRNRCGFKFSNTPQVVEVDNDQLKMIEEDKYLRIITKGTPFQQAIDTAKKQGIDVSMLEKPEIEENPGENEKNPEENHDSEPKTEENTPESDENQSDDETQADDEKNSSENDNSEEKDLIKPEIEEYLKKFGIEYKTRDKKEILETLLRETLIKKLKEAGEEFSDEADIKDLIALATAE